MQLATFFRLLLCLFFVFACEEQKAPESKKEGSAAANPSTASGSCSSLDASACSSNSSCSLNATTGKCESAASKTPPACSTLTKNTCNENPSCQVKGTQCIDPTTEAEACKGKNKTECKDSSCLWSTADGLCEVNPCKDLLGTKSCNENSLCRFDNEAGVCQAKTDANSCQGLSESKCDLKGQKCSWDGSECIALTSSCDGLSQKKCDNDESCSWNETSELCESDGEICPSLKKADCRTNAACLLIDNQCVSAAGDCGENTSPEQCNITEGCQWYVTMRSCGRNTDANASSRWADEQKFKSRLVLAAGLGALQGLLGGGGVRGAFTNSLDSMTSIASGSPTMGGLAGAYGGGYGGGRMGGLFGGSGFGASTGIDPMTGAPIPAGYGSPTWNPAGRTIDGTMAPINPSAQVNCAVIGTEYQCRRLEPRCTWVGHGSGQSPCILNSGF